ncbi:hypothetical protein WICPIJ_000946 [Wickerhamomyces pijperi]|uniref:Uncharacterized protein n=1 Tax=Wickerhamomyces pijperi TaxID=599730 RepID=A0A9P8QF80_WICPI|nr:hypothetical protein WICPIJ_000946 [Wickerhamomyces pijperi]
MRNANFNNPPSLVWNVCNHLSARDLLLASSLAKGVSHGSPLMAPFTESGIVGFCGLAASLTSRGEEEGGEADDDIGSSECNDMKSESQVLKTTLTNSNKV